MLPPTKPLIHNLLFGSPAVPNMQINLIVALDYIARFVPTVGFSVEEARSVQNVTVVGRAIDPASEQALKSAGCVVRHIDGADKLCGRAIVCAIDCVWESVSVVRAKHLHLVGLTSRNDLANASPHRF